MGAVGWSSRLGRSGRSPYTEDEDAYTTRGFFFWRAAATRTWSVPVTFEALAPSGSATERGTERIAAWWKTAVTPRTARSTVARLLRSPRMILSRLLPFAKARLARLPVEKLSSTRTRCPCASRRSTTCEPMKPAPPVTR